MPFSCAGLGEADAGRGSDQARLIVYLGVVFRGLADGLAPQFAVTVVSPAVEVAVRTDGQGVVVACADLGEVDTIWRSDKARRALFFFRGSQYVVVVSPAVEVAVRSDSLGTFYFCGIIWLKRISGLVGGVRVILVSPVAFPEVGERLQALVPLVQWAVRVRSVVTGCVKS